jgi:hypothetical protein
VAVMMVQPDGYFVAFLYMIVMLSLNFHFRFWVALRFQQLLFQRKFGRAGSVEEMFINSRLFVWAYHSDSVENLFGSVIPNEPSWQEMRALGMGFWYASIPQLRARVMFGPVLFRILLCVLYEEISQNKNLEIIAFLVNADCMMLQEKLGFLVS